MSTLTKTITPKPFRLGGEWRTSASADGALTSINPADGSVAGVVTRALPKDVDDAVAAATDAFRNQPWRNLRMDQRAATLYEVSRRLHAEKESLARLEPFPGGLQAQYVTPPELARAKTRETVWRHPICFLRLNNPQAKSVLAAVYQRNRYLSIAAREFISVTKELLSLEKSS